MYDEFRFQFVVFFTRESVAHLPVPEWEKRSISLELGWDDLENVLSKYDLRDWKFVESKTTPSPHYSFELRVETTAGTADVEGLIPEEKNQIYLSRCPVLLLYDILKELNQYVDPEIISNIQVGYDMHLVEYRKGADKADFFVAVTNSLLDRDE